jgi:hypothetical protein
MAKEGENEVTEIAIGLGQCWHATYRFTNASRNTLTRRECFE